MTTKSSSPARGSKTKAARASGAAAKSLETVFDAVVCEGRAIDEVSRALAVSRAVVDTRLRRMRTRLAA